MGAKRANKKKKAGGREITAFCCENSAYVAAGSLRGDSLMRSVELIPVPCLGRVEVVEILRCLEGGTGTVLLL